MVVGRQLKISKPSIRGWGRIPGKNISMHFVIGNPTKNGQAPKVIVWINPFNFIFDAAFVSSCSLRLMPLIRKMVVTPYFPMNNSGRMTLPFLPSSGNNLANETAAIIPSKKKFFDTYVWILRVIGTEEGSPPPRSSTTPAASSLKHWEVELSTCLVLGESKNFGRLVITRLVFVLSSIMANAFDSGSVEQAMIRAIPMMIVAILDA